MINFFGNDEEFQLLQLQQRGRQLEQENFQLRKELSNFRSFLKFNLHKIEVKNKDKEYDKEKEQIKYILTHSTQIKNRKAEIKFSQHLSKTLTLQGLGYYQDQEGTLVFQIFSYNIIITNELQVDPNIIATDQKIEIIFVKNT